jgi:hypothetical protein
MVVRYLAGIAVSIVPTLGLAQGDRFDALANSAMFEHRPTPETNKLLRDELIFQRATQTYLWALPLVSTLGMKTGSEKIFGVGVGFQKDGTPGFSKPFPR